MKHYKTFFSYVIPSVLAFALSGIYSIVDGFFVGNSIGDIGLSSINIAYPVVSLLQAAGTGIGMGGAVLYSVANAAKDKERADCFTSGTVQLLFISSFLLTAVLYLFIEPILRLLGAEGRTMQMGTEYLRIIIFGAVFQIFATGIVPIIRNHNGAVFAMGSMIAGFIANIILDYMLVWRLEYGMSGAALATAIGQGMTMAAGIIYLYVKKVPFCLKPMKQAGNVFSRICKVGIAPFGLTLSPILSLALMNYYSMQYGGTQAVACYACISYATYIVYLLLQGVSDGCQPLMSQFYGRGSMMEVRLIRKSAYIFSVGLAIVCLLILYCTRYDIGILFGASDDVAQSVGNVIYIFLIGFVFLAFTRVTTSCFYATEQSLYSYLLVYAEPVLLGVFLLIVPQFWGQTGVWWSLCVAQVTASFMAFLLKHRSDRQRR